MALGGRVTQTTTRANSALTSTYNRG